eukprot:CAMPEP_0202011074 /NCGR_PEP_ID=MMETSP0905-20130828/18342_1 /ASSEMBLY_ACC=CAM_ASM_000554 /TAXON_ID=420261 /ORGANISM="Thalassiosira antarctica, Strain CCMP982" /LENGTH=80 /DNA_ID=CAMNT_0048569785 /DNA_START=34 /DNA_END=272 /DNA_ORIENTATION=+
MMKLAILTAISGSAAAFAPSASIGASSNALRMSDETADTIEEPIVIPAAVVINGWSSDAVSPLGDAFPCYGLPGTVSPLG